MSRSLSLGPGISLDRHAEVRRVLAVALAAASAAAAAAPLVGAERALAALVWLAALLLLVVAPWEGRVEARAVADAASPGRVAPNAARPPAL